jgi:ubiquinone/menaquinone biosynthesis C-methylase UbiE
VSDQPVEQIYGNPDAYDLEHAKSEPDIGFFVRLSQRWKPADLLEVACGNGRVTIPVAKAARSWKGNVSGLEMSAEMLKSARAKPDADLVTWHQGDVREWKSELEFDVIFSPCASLSHLLTIEDQLATWRNVQRALKPGGRFVIAEMMANLPVLAESMQIPPRVALEIDADQEHRETGKRLLRYRTTRYHAESQNAMVHFIYDQFSGGQSENPERFLSDYESHVYFPRELQLLFIATGFEIEAVWGGYGQYPLVHTSREIVICGRKVGEVQPGA